MSWLSVFIYLSRKNCYFWKIENFYKVPHFCLRMFTTLLHTRDVKSGNYCCYVSCVTSIVHVWKMSWPINRFKLSRWTVPGLSDKCIAIKWLVVWSVTNCRSDNNIHTCVCNIKSCYCCAKYFHFQVRLWLVQLDTLMLENLALSIL